MHPNFEYERRVTFADTDMAGVAHFTAILRWVEEAEASWWRERGGRLCTVDSAGVVVGWPKVSVTVDYLSPVKFEDVVVIALGIEREGRSSRTWNFTVQRRKDGSKVAKGTMTVVHVARSPDGVVETRPLS